MFEARLPKATLLKKVLEAVKDLVCFGLLWRSSAYREID